MLYHSFSVAFQGRIIARAVFLVSFHSPLFMELNSGSCVFILLLGLSVRLMEVNRNALVCQWDYAVYAIKCTSVSVGLRGICYKMHWCVRGIERVKKDKRQKRGI